MVVDPKDPNIVVASTQGDATHNGRGIYRTTDGGESWQELPGLRGYPLVRLENRLERFVGGELLADRRLDFADLTQDVVNQDLGGIPDVAA